MYCFHFSFRLASLLELFIFLFFPLLPTFFPDIVTALFLPLDVSPHNMAFFFTTIPDSLYTGTFRENRKKMYWGKNRSREYSKGNKTVPGKVATTHTEDGHKQDT